jgi:alcohol dehydrogenase (cytochrome c)
VNRTAPAALALTALALTVGVWPVRSQTPTADRGQAIFNENCAGCHGATAEGRSAPDLTSPRWHLDHSDAQIDAIIRDGIPNTAMPAFGDRLSDDDRQAIVHLLRDLSSKSIQPATSVVAPPVHVEPARLLATVKDPDNWLLYAGDYGQRRYSALASINRSTVKNLVPVWSFQTGVPDGLTGMPLAVDGVIYLTTAWNHAFAIDARTGAELWHYQRKLPATNTLSYCCGPSNRGVSIWNDLVFMTTLDAHLVALEARTGRVRWDIELGRSSDHLNFKQPPLVVGNRLFVGSAGGDEGGRGFIDAYDAATGKQLWRFYTVPGPGEPGHETWPNDDTWKTGGGAPWMSGSYDPDENLIYWGVGQPYPVYDTDARPGDNLYTSSVVALEPETGRLRWHYQYTPHDVWDYDGVTENVPVDISYQGQPRKVIIHADRNGYFYAIDRTNGRFLFAKPIVQTSWASGFTPDGHPMVNPGALPTYGGVDVCPGAAGGKQWTGMAYSAITHWAYLPIIENCATFFNYGVRAKAEGLAPGPSGFRYLPGQAYGKVIAIDPATGDVKWSAKTRSPMSASMLATAGGLVFTGDAEGNVVAYDDKTGALLWSYQTGSGIRSGPIAFKLDGVEYIAVASGLGGAVGGYTGPGAPWLRNYRGGGTLFVFRLFQPNASNQFRAGAGR